MMDQPADMDYADLADESPAVEETSVAYLVRWNRLVSTTNWEKGRIIFEWRSSLIEAGSPVESYSDEAWSRRVGNVSGQHVGRLRRVYERFGADHEQYAGLYWSHFQAALDWDDAEMWLEGAVQNRWSISQMRDARWEATGAAADLKPRDEDVINAELDEDAAEPGPDVISEATAEVRDVSDDESSPRDAFDDDHEPDEIDDVGFDATDDQPAAAEPVRPFAELPKLPDDLADALESMKLAIVSHKLTHWSDVSRDAVLDALDALKQLALSPA